MKNVKRFAALLGAASLLSGTSLCIAAPGAAAGAGGAAAAPVAPSAPTAAAPGAALPPNTAVINGQTVTVPPQTGPTAGANPTPGPNSFAPANTESTTTLPRVVRTVHGNGKEYYVGADGFVYSRGDDGRYRHFGPYRASQIGNATQNPTTAPSTPVPVTPGLTAPSSGGSPAAQNQLPTPLGVQNNVVLPGGRTVVGTTVGANGQTYYIGSDNQMYYRGNDGTVRVYSNTP